MQTHDFPHRCRSLIDLGDRIGGIDEIDRHLRFRMREDIQDVAGFDNLAQLHNRDAVTDFLDDRHFVRDQDDRDAQLLIDFLQQLENAGGRLRIQRAGRLVAQQHFRIVGQCPRNCDPLLLPAGQLRGISVPAFRSARPVPTDL